MFGPVCGTKNLERERAYRQAATQGGYPLCDMRGFLRMHLRIALRQLDDGGNDQCH
jgi:hypothetical protein